MFVSIRSQATTISRKADQQCTEAEVLLVTLLLHDRIDEGFDFDGWAATVVAESAAFVPGAPWSATGKPLATAQEKLESRLPGLNPARVAVVGTAAMLYDGAGRAAAVYTRAQFDNYLLRSLLAPPRSATVWLGVSHAGSSLTRGATLRRAYIRRSSRGSGATRRRVFGARSRPRRPRSARRSPQRRPPQRPRCVPVARRDAARARRRPRTRDVTARARARSVTSLARAQRHMAA